MGCFLGLDLQFALASIRCWRLVLAKRLPYRESQCTRLPLSGVCVSPGKVVELRLCDGEAELSITFDVKTIDAASSDLVRSILFRNSIFFISRP